jgi:flavorubredoxin
MIKGLDFKKKKATSFGSYGWSGESVQILSDRLEAAGFEIVQPGIKALWNPDEAAKAECFEFGKSFAKSFK